MRREQGTGNRGQGTGDREQGTGFAVTVLGNLTFRYLCRFFPFTYLPDFMKWVWEGVLPSETSTMPVVNQQEQD
jgi:hypothetical protein